jgi:hypothetical protein
MENRIVLNEAALNLHRVAENSDSGRYALNAVHIDADGTAVAADGHMLLAVGPVPDREADQAVEHCGFAHHRLQGAVLVSADQVEEARKNLPA